VRILFTGGSSFTGTWFIRELAAAGHQITATFRHDAEAYPDEVRRSRVELAVQSCRPVFGVSFGDERFLALAKEPGWDLLGHHAADVTNYRSMGFDPVAALRNNANNLPAVLDALRDSGCGKVLLTGSVFENGEGAGSQGLPDFSPYGLSKTLTSQTFRYYCGRAAMHLGKFVISNPFGPFEEPRYTSYLMKSWFQGATPRCNNPAYVRDNIHVSLLAKTYVAFAEGLPATAGFSRIGPSGYPESQGAFTLRLAAEMRPRLRLPCPVELKAQAEFPEPRVRINVDIPDARALGWNESAAWDEMARYYQRLLGKS
jgi:nucleoside-diphosphate-sugar epimerase